MRLKLVYPSQPFLLSEVPRPDGSLGLLYIASALREAGYDVSVLDMAVGDASNSLQHSFFRHTPIDEDTVRVGLSRKLSCRKSSPAATWSLSRPSLR